MKISLDNIQEFAVETDQALINQYFNDGEKNSLSDEHRDQIFIFKKEASKFLWDYEINILGIEASAKYYKSIFSYDSSLKEKSQIKKYLYNLGIPFDNWVFIAEQPLIGFMLTWKMVIKYADNFFSQDQTVWDKTLNWKLEFHHDGIFTYGQDLIYKAETEGEKIAKQLAERKSRKP